MVTVKADRSSASPWFSDTFMSLDACTHEGLMAGQGQSVIHYASPVSFCPAELRWYDDSLAQSEEIASDITATLQQ